MTIIKKIGGYKVALKVLQNAGWNPKRPYANLVIQNFRNSFSTEVALILFNYCRTHGIDVTIDDFLTKRG